MAKVRHLQTNFTGGQITSEALGRKDLARYQNAVKAMTNFHPTVLGGMRRRDGTEYLASYVTNDALFCIPFTGQGGRQFVLVVGDDNIHPYRVSDGARAESAAATPINIAFPTAGMGTTYDASGIDYAQVGAAMVLVSSALRPYTITHTYSGGYDAFTFTATGFSIPAQLESEVRYTNNLTLSATTGTITATASSNSFTSADVGRQIKAGSGLATITAYTSATQVTCVSVGDFDRTSYTYSAPNARWFVTDAEFVAVTPSGSTTQVGGAVTLTAGAAAWKDGTYNRPSVGLVVSINGGRVRITGYSSTTVVTGVVLEVLTSVSAAQAGQWYYVEDAWSDPATGGNGWPRCVALYQSRLVLGGTDRQPSTVWFSKTGEYTNFKLGVNDNDGMTWDLGGTEYDQLLWLAPYRTLIAHCTNNEFSFYGRNDGALTPTGTRLSPLSAFGASTVKPVKIDNEDIFVDASGQRIRSVSSLSYDGSEISGDELSILGRDLIAADVVRMAYMQAPYQQLFALTDDGQLAVLTFDRGQQVFGWHRYDVGGLVVDVVAASKTSLWLIVARTINGVTSHYLERLNSAATLDCSKAYTGASSATWTASHLPNTDVQAWSDGSYMGDFTTDGSGQITLGRAVTSVTIGLSYESSATMLPIELSTSSAVGGKAGKLNEICVLVHESQALSLNGDPQAFRQFPVPLNGAIPEYTGYLTASKFGIEAGQPDIVLSCSAPLKCHILSAIRIIEVFS